MFDCIFGNLHDDVKTCYIREGKRIITIVYQIKDVYDDDDEECIEIDVNAGGCIYKQENDQWNRKQNRATAMARFEKYPVKTTITFSRKILDEFTSQDKLLHFIYSSIEHDIRRAFKYGVKSKSL